MAMYSPHLAEVNDNLGIRLVVLQKQLPKEPLNALVIKIDSIKRNVDRDELMALISNPRSGQEKDFINVLHKAGFLDLFYHSGYIEKMSVDKINLTPGDGKKYPLRQMINMINEKAGLKQLPTQDQIDNLSSADPRSAEKQEELEDKSGKKQIARNLFLQWKMMFEEAERKLKEATNIDATLRLSADEMKKSTIFNPSIISMQEPKKRGRKKKA